MLVSLKHTAKLLKEQDNFLLLMHQSPDGDTIGACYGLAYVLQAMGKNVRTLCSDELPKKYEFLYRDFVQSKEVRSRFTVSLDIADTKLLGRYEQTYAGKIALCIDHHISNTLYAENTLLDAGAAAVCEIAYAAAKLLDIQIPSKSALCFYTGIATDTGCFKFGNVTPQTHILAAEIMEKYPNDYAAVNHLLFDVKSAVRIKLETVLLENMEFYSGGRCSVTWVTSEDIDRLGGECELDGLSAVALQPQGTEVGILIRQKGNSEIFKVSMRSTGNIDVASTCKKFGGGGHKNAAGATVSLPLGEVKKKFALEADRLIREHLSAN
ncbi:MAG: DHH family phosphoesterase [Oscillospiraceae bacterium]|nr:DHH family phosphoesterase [Oscillospiraceae bacterium]